MFNCKKKKKKVTPISITSPATPVSAPATPVTTTEETMPTVSIAIINESTVCTDAEIKGYIDPLQTQVSRDYAPVWGLNAILTFYSKGSTIPSDSWQIAILDNSNQAGALGYHQTTTTGMPQGFVFAATDKQYKSSVSVTISHELLEMLADPGIISATAVQDAQGNMTLYALENCDAVEDDSLGYIIDGILVSDFVYPSYFSVQPLEADQNKYDFCGHVTSPLQILAGGYLGVWTFQNGWTQKTGADRVDDPSAVAPVLSRRQRRTVAQSEWQPSVKTV